MANSFFNPKNQHLKNLVPVGVKKEQTDAAADDYIDLSWLNIEELKEAIGKSEVDDDVIKAINEQLKEIESKVTNEITDRESAINELKNLLSETIIYKTIDVVKDDEVDGLFKVELPENSNIEKITYKKMTLYPVSVVDDFTGNASTYQITLYSPEQAPEGFAHYGAIKVLYSCTYGAYLNWQKH